MRITVAGTAEEMGRLAATQAAELLRTSLSEHNEAAIIVATGTSQFETLRALTQAKGIDWPRVTGFHLDEYLGLPMTHPASFRRYLRERFVDQVPLRAFHYIDGDGDPAAECRRLGNLIRGTTINVALIGIGENGHLAFNDPPADFGTQEPYHVVTLDEACRRQQLGEGWFDSIHDVPSQAISMSIAQIMKSRAIVCSVPDRRKAAAVQRAVQDPVTPDMPASILQQHPNVTLHLDSASAELLDPEILARHVVQKHSDSIQP
jgi:glucosamine-6-phosphate deaminase